MRMLCVVPYRSIVFLAATALAAPHENHTTMVGLVTPSHPDKVVCS